ncbi:MAG: radical SAM protein [Parcubacteria group bacterium]|nr:radical SAM protein [Parcubacteria group bacterium]
MTTYQAISTPIIKPINGLCNLSCSYCYASGLKKRTGKNRMHPEVLKATIDFFCHNQNDIEFIWHGGEPLLAGIDFYRKAVEYQRVWEQKGRKITNSIQTNATLITFEWVNFFTEHDFFVGVSLDGPKHFHDRVRYYPNKTGSYDNVMRGIELLRRAKVFNGIICSISTVDYQSPKEIFSFFIKEDIKKLKFARVKDIGHCNDVSSLTILPKQYIDFMITIFDLWLELDNPEVEIRDIQSVVSLILGGNKRECIYMGRCDQFVTVYHDGSIYGCDSFPKTNVLNFGNVMDKSTLAKSNPRLEKFQEILRKRKENCRVCDWYFICKGGCAKDCYAQLNSIKPINEVCENLKRYFEYISVKIKSYGFI